MNWLQVLVLSLVQGVTEFLPVSSSAHLILVPELLGWQDQGMSFDIAVHVGTLIAVLSYFRQDIDMIIKDLIKFIQDKKMSHNAQMGFFIGFATIPVGFVGLLFKHYIETSLRSPLVIALTTIIFGLILWLSDVYSSRSTRQPNLTWKDVIVIGCAQAISLIPGTSRSGITLTAGLFCGLKREVAAKFSFLLSIPVIILAGGLETWSLIKNPITIDWSVLGAGIFLSALSGYFCIHYFLKLLNKIGVLPFVLYRLVLGIFLIFHYVL